MKKILIILAVVLIGLPAMGQNDLLVREYQGKAERVYGLFEKNEKNKTRFYHWFDLAESLVGLYEANTRSLDYNRTQPADLIRIYNGAQDDPESVVESEEDGKKVVIYTYSHIQLKFVNDRLQNWELRNIIYDDLLDRSVEALNKCVELNPGNDEEASQKIEYMLATVRQAFNVLAFIEYSKENYEAAYHNTVAYLDLTEKANEQDTTSQIYAIYYAQYAGLKDELLESFNQAVEKNYRERGNNRGHMFLFAHDVYMERKDTASALATMLKGAEFYPDNYDIVIKLIDIYRAQNRNSEAVAFIEKAKVMDPNNSTLLLIEASLQSRMGHTEEAMDLYRKVIDLDPNNFRSYLNLGAAEYQKGRDMLIKATDEPDNASYVIKKKEAEDQLNIAIPFLEKAASIEPNEVEILETLKSLYYLLRVRFPEYEARYQEISTKLGGEPETK